MNSLQTANNKPEPTKTELLLRNAHELCTAITGFKKVSNSLLVAVFQSLREELIEHYDPAKHEVH